jgi:hypothetical protein
MIRSAVLVLTSLLLGSGVAAANVTGSAPRQVVVQRHRGWIASDANPKHTWLYVTGFSNNVVSIYDLERPGSPEVGEITDGIDTPNGVTIDAHGTVYVANSLAPNVTIYSPGTTTPSLTLTTGLTHPVNVAIDASGDVYVSNRGSTPSIVVYPPGQSTPSATITSSVLQIPTQIVFDSTGDLYISDNGAGISKIPVGSQQPVSLGFQGLVYPSGIALDPGSGDAFVSQAGGGKTLVFDSGHVNPSRTLKDSVDVDLLAVGSVKRREYLFVANSQSNTVALFQMGRRKSTATVATNAQNLVGVGVKPAGVP